MQQPVAARSLRVQPPRHGALAALTFVLLACPLPASAAPMDLRDPTPRWVVVRFEASPTSDPQRLDGVYSRPFLAWLEPGPLAGLVRVRVGGDVVERSLLHARNPVPGSFSDYVWTFDVESGAVLSAELAGVLRHELDWGLGTINVEARVAARMATTRAGGFLPARPIWGRRLRRFCDHPSAECTLVPAVPYDPERGYVNAVGYLQVDSAITSFSLFSALGEAVFSELEPGGERGALATSVDAGVSPAPASYPLALPETNADASLMGAIDVSAEPPRIE